VEGEKIWERGNGGDRSCARDPLREEEIGDGGGGRSGKKSRLLCLEVGATAKKGGGNGGQRAHVGKKICLPMSPKEKAVPALRNIEFKRAVAAKNG